VNSRGGAFARSAGFPEKFGNERGFETGAPAYIFAPAG